MTYHALLEYIRKAKGHGVSTTPISQSVCSQVVLMSISPQGEIGKMGNQRRYPQEN